MPSFLFSNTNSFTAQHVRHKIDATAARLLGLKRALSLSAALFWLPIAQQMATLWFIDAINIWRPLIIVNMTSAYAYGRHLNYLRGKWLTLKRLKAC